MSKKIIEYKLKNGSIAKVEVVDENTRASRGEDEEVIKATETFEDVLCYIAPTAQSVVDTFKDLNTPKEIGLEFNLKFTAKAGVVFASMGSEASFKVSIKWSNS